MIRSVQGERVNMVIHYGALKRCHPSDSIGVHKARQRYLFAESTRAYISELLDTGMIPGVAAYALHPHISSPNPMQLDPHDHAQLTLAPGADAGEVRAALEAILKQQGVVAKVDEEAQHDSTGWIQYTLGGHSPTALSKAKPITTKLSKEAYLAAKRAAEAEAITDDLGRLQWLQSHIIDPVEQQLRKEGERPRFKSLLPLRGGMYHRHRLRHGLARARAKLYLSMKLSLRERAWRLSDSDVDWHLSTDSGASGEPVISIFDACPHCGSINEGIASLMVTCSSCGEAFMLEPFFTRGRRGRAKPKAPSAEVEEDVEEESDSGAKAISR